MAMNLMDIDDVGGKVHDDPSSIGSTTSLPYRQLGIKCISLEIEHTGSTYILPLSKVQTIQLFLKTLHSLPEVKASLPNLKPKSNGVKPVVDDDPIYDEINIMADYFDNGSWIINGYQGCIVRLQDWEDLLHNGASITIVVHPNTKPADSKEVPDPETEPLTTKNTNTEENNPKEAVVVNGWDTPPPLTRDNKSATFDSSANNIESGWGTADTNNDIASSWNNDSAMVLAQDGPNDWNVEDPNHTTQNKLSSSRWGNANTNTPPQQQQQQQQQGPDDQNSISDNASGSGRDRKHKWNHNSNQTSSSRADSTTTPYKSSKPGPPRVFGATKEPPYLFTFVNHPNLPLQFPLDTLEHDVFEIDYPAGATYWELLKAVTYHYRIPRPKTHMATIDLTITQLKADNTDGEERLIKGGGFTALGSTLMKDVGVPRLKAGERLYMMLE